MSDIFALFSNVFPNNNKFLIVPHTIAIHKSLLLAHFLLGPDHRHTERVQLGVQSKCNHS